MKSLMSLPVQKYMYLKSYALRYMSVPFIKLDIGVKKSQNGSSKQNKYTINTHIQLFATHVLYADIHVYSI